MLKLGKQFKMENLDLIDTHAHLYALEEPIEDVISRAKEMQVNRTICIGAGYGLESADLALEMANTHDSIYASVGIHPQNASKEVSIEQLADKAKNKKVVAIGETGLDYFKDWSPVDEQKRVFRESIELAKELDKPLIIHCREAIADTIEIIKTENAKKVGGVFHCYAGDAELAAELLKLNFIVSFTGVITFKNAKNVQEIARKIPLEQIMLETDCPYMAPEPHRGKKSEPSHVYHIAQKLAEIKGLCIEEVAQITTENAKRLFNF